MFKIKNLCASLALICAPAAFAEELSDTGEFLDGVAAIVNEGVVLKSQLRDQTAMVIERAAQADPPMQLPPPDVLRDQLLERAIVLEIQLQRAERIGLQISDAMLNQAIEQLAVSQGVAPGAQHTKNPGCGAKIGRGVDHLDSKIFENRALALENVSNTRIDRQKSQIWTESDPSPCEVPL